MYINVNEACKRARLEAFVTGSRCSDASKSIFTLTYPIPTYLFPCLVAFRLLGLVFLLLLLCCCSSSSCNSSKKK